MLSSSSAAASRREADCAGVLVARRLDDRLSRGERLAFRARGSPTVGRGGVVSNRCDQVCYDVAAVDAEMQS